ATSASATTAAASTTGSAGCATGSTCLPLLITAIVATMAMIATATPVITGHRRGDRGGAVTSELALEPSVVGTGSAGAANPVGGTVAATKPVGGTVAATTGPVATTSGPVGIAGPDAGDAGCSMRDTALARSQPSGPEYAASACARFA